MNVKNILLFSLLVCASIAQAAEVGQANSEGNALAYALKVSKPLTTTTSAKDTCPNDTALSVLLDGKKQQLWQRYWLWQASQQQDSALYQWVYGQKWLSKFKARLYSTPTRPVETAKTGDNYRLEYEFPMSEQANLAYPDKLVFDVVFQGFINASTPDLFIALNPQLSRIAGVADLKLAMNHRMVSNPCVVATLNAAVKQQRIELQVAGKPVRQLQLSDELLPSRQCVVEVHQQQQLLGSFMMAATQC